MTINVAVVSCEALVLGCDSIASTSNYVLDPFALSKQVKKKGGGKYQLDFSLHDLTQHVVGAWGNVTKMFPLQTEGACVAAVTAGLAHLNDRTMSNLAAEFLLRQHERSTLRINVKAIARDFLKFIRREYDRHYDSSLLPNELREGPTFLVGGYGRDDHLPSLYRVNVQDNTVTGDYEVGEYGFSWAGQSDAVVRLIRGYDVPLKGAIDKEVQKAIDNVYASTSDAVARIIAEVLAALGLEELPDGVDTSLPPKKSINLPWDSEGLGIDCKSLPTQDAIDFASFLVNMQSARSKFVPGVATVGGRTHIGVMTKSTGFSMLNEPELRHRNTGFIDDV